MTKRLFSLLAIMLFAMAAWADDLATFSSQTIWTADDYSGGSVFGKDSRGKKTSGTFDGTTIVWNASQVLTCNANAVLSFGYSGSGKLHVVYGATSKTDGTFYVKVKKNGESVFTNAKELAMGGVAYSGKLGTRSGDYKYTLAETAVDLTGSGAINIEADRGYCIYAILYDPLMTVDSETTWTFENFTASTSITVKDKLYQRATTARYFTFVDESGSGSFTDGKNVSWTKVARSTTSAYLGLSATTTASTASGDATPFMAFDAAVPGTCYALVKSSNNGNIRIYFTDGEATSGGTGKANTNSAELTEIQLTATTTGTFFIGGVSSNQRDIYAIRFVPAAKYAVTTASASNGTITVDKSEAAEGETVTITATPASSYQLNKLTVTKTGSTEETTVTGNTFTMPGYPVTVSATFQIALGVTVTDNANNRVLDNGLLTVTIDDNGQITSIINKGNNQEVMQSTDESQKGYFNFNYRPLQSGSTYDNGLTCTSSGSIVQIGKSGDDMIELIYPMADASTPSHQTWKIGYVMKKGVSGIYTYAILDGSSSYSELHEARYGWRVNPNIFNYAWVSDNLKGSIPAPSELPTDAEEEAYKANPSSSTKIVQDATYKLSNGSIYTKYDWANFVKDDHLHGIMGSNTGAWLISPSTEWVNGAAQKQELTVHATNKSPIILQTMHSRHFGAGAAVLTSSNDKKMFGPCLFYVNSGTSKDAMISDAKAKAEAELAAWPYDWLTDNSNRSGFVKTASSRGTVSGTVNVNGGFVTDKVQVVLTQGLNNEKPLLDANGYQYYTEATVGSSFTIKNVRPGSYTLYVYALNGDATGTYKHSGSVTVNAGANDVGTINWTPDKYGTALWRIGEADHSTKGFKLSDQNRKYGLWNDVPEAQTYTIGTSTEANDWYYAQVKNNGTWSIKFNNDKSFTKPLRLTIATAGSSSTPKLEVKMNSNMLNNSKNIDYSSDNGIARSAVLGGRDSLVVLDVPASYMKSGENTLNLKVWNLGSSTGGVMYDCIKLEAVNEDGTYDFQDYAINKVVSTTQPQIVLDRDANGIIKGFVQPDGTTFREIMELNDKFAVSSGDVKLRKNNNKIYNGLFIPSGKTASLTIKNLTAGDWIKMNYNDNGHVIFASTNVKTVSGSTVADGDAVGIGETYVASSSGDVVLTISDNTYIYSIQVTNTAMAPTVSYKENKDGKAVYTITSLDGNNIEYKLGEGETVKPGAKTAEISVSEKTTLTTWAVNGTATGAQAIVELLSTPIVESDGLFDFQGKLSPLGNDRPKLTVSSEVGATVGDISLYKPSFELAATFANRFAFQTPTSANTALRKDMVYIDKGENGGTYYIALLNASAGHVLTVNDQWANAKLYVGKEEKAYTIGEGYTVTASDLDSKGNLILKFDVSEGNFCIQKLSLQALYTSEATLEANDATKDRKDVKIFEAKNLGDGETLKYILPGQETIRTYTNAITVRESGDLVYWIESATGSTARRTITLRLTATPSVNTSTFTLNDTESIYTLSYTKGNTVYYTLPGESEKSATGDGTLELTVKKPGRLVAYAKLDDQVSDTLKTNVFVKTPAIAENGVYNFAKIADVIGGDYTLNTRPSGETVTIGGITLTKPDDVVANTLDRFAFASKRIDASNGRLYETDWRLLNAGRLRSSGTVADTLAILNAKKGDYLLMTFSGKLNYMSQSTAKLAEGTDELTSKQAYEVLSDGDILIVNKSGTTSDITLLTITDTEVVSSPYFTERNAENEVVLNVGESSLGKKTYTYYTLDGEEPTTGSYTISEKTTIKVENGCTVKAISISETGVKSGIASYTFNLTMASTSAKKMYDLAALVNNGDTLKFDISSVKVSVMENNAGWEEKSRDDFVPVRTFNNKISIRVGYESVDYVQVDSVTMAFQLKRAMAVHDLAVGDRIVIMYEGGGSLINVTPTGADSFTAGGKKIAIGEEVPSGAEIVVTNATYSQNYLVFNVTGTVYITAIYINSDAPEVVIRPQVEQTSVSTNTATYHITWEKGAFLYYTLSTDNDSIIYEGGTSGELDIVVEKSAKLTVWAERDGIVSQELAASVFAPTPAPSTKSEYDFAEAAQDLPADIEVELDPKQEVKVNNIKLYKPTAMTAKTFNGKFVFEETNTSGKIKIRQNRNLLFSRGADMRMAVLDLSRGDIVAFDFSGTIQINNSDMLEEIRTGNNRTRAAASVSEMESGTAYRVTESGDLLLTMKLSDLAVNIAKMYVGEGPDRSEPMAIDFATAAEEEDSVVFGNSAAVWYGDRTQIVVYKRITNNSELMPVNGKITSEGGYGTLDVSGFKNSRRDIAIHSVAVGDTIKVRFSGGDMFYNGHDEKGTRISVNGKTLERGDTIHSGDVLTVSQVDYLYNYVVLQFDARAVISGIFINTPEIEKILMPTITVKSNNTFVITAGKSTVGNEVVTCFTTDGTEPTLVNGTSGPYEKLEVQVLRGGEMTIKAISYSYDLKMSKVAEASFTAVDLTAQAATRGMTSSIDGRIMIDGEAFKDMQIFDMQGRRVSAIKPNMLYIINGKKVYYHQK